MTSSRVLLALVLVMVAVLLAAGCAAWQEHSVDNLTANPVTIQKTVATSLSPVMTTDPVTSEPSGKQEKIVKNTTQWIQIDTVGARNTNDIFTITGTTNLPVGEELIYSVELIEATPPGKQWNGGSLPPPLPTTHIVEGSGGINTWSFDVNLGNRDPGTYSVWINKANMVFPEDNGSGAETTFEVTSSPSPWIHIDPVSDHKTGDRFAVHGTTNLPAGDQIRIEVYEGSWDSLSPKGKGPFWFNTTVKNDDSGSNTWSINLDSSGFLTGNWYVAVNGVTRYVKNAVHFEIS
jgi:hypothetical protein